MAENLNRNHAATGWLASALEALVAMGDAVARFPVTVVFLFLTATYANALVADVDLVPAALPGAANKDDLLFALIAAVIASFAATLFAQARQLSALISVALPVLAGVAAFAVMWPDITERTVEWAFVLSLMALAPIAPFAWRGTGDAFWMFTARLVFAVGLGLLAFVLFGGGISAILASLTHLFGIDVPNDLYEHIWASIGLFVAPLFGLGQTPRTFDEEPGGHEHALMQSGMRALGDFAAVPMLIIYALILHLYAAKIAITGEVPQGQIGWLVLTYGVCIVAVLLLTKPFLDTARAPTRFFVRFWPLFLLAPLGLLFYALALRVGAFGWTPQRYFLGLFGLVTLALVGMQALPRLRGDIRLIAGIPVLALLLGSFGPQGALDWSVRSQTARFLELVNDTPLSVAAKSEALSVLHYLNGEDAVGAVEPEGFALSPDGNAYREVAIVWGLDPDNPVHVDRNGVFYSNPSIVAFDTTGFDVVVQNAIFLDGEPGTFDIVLPDGGKIALLLKQNAVSVKTANGVEGLFPLEEERIASLASLDGQTVMFSLEAEGRKILIVPSHLHATFEPELELRNMTGTLLLRLEDWK
ncbi:DUF4153 domain-containing protein [Nitratireductor aquimarinus]|uniref:DUF4153 domain-containing protein n=1 Tax=Nitratireductor aquimarinus TaxID=889300 RepID=UPI001A90631C|nr:DUF4153 domain-containing protein [Nitratireductor aquimarinus]MBN8244484.1 DUF4153 domain-containing protein [Nitratireductor aquimarinus]MBY6132872.1 DUF4153 domain-containing protein [Nitratireductor aquimarinus]MCA1301716.1 DUF4153 domain-containing protein [Nitratireductor aquimarinus]